MNQVTDLLSGRKTYMLGGILFLYILAENISGRDPDQSVVAGLLAAMGVTLRAGVEKGAKG